MTIFQMTGRKKIFGDDPQVHTNPESNFSSKYGNGFTFSAEAPMIDLPQPSVILSEIENDTANISRYSMKIAPNRPVNRIEIYELNDINFQDFSANGLAAGSLKKSRRNLPCARQKVAGTRAHLLCNQPRYVKPGIQF